MRGATDSSVGRARSRAVDRPVGATPGPSSLKHGQLMTEDGALSRQRGTGSSHAIEGPKDQKEP